MLTVSFTEATMHFHDSVTAMTAGNGCVQVDANRTSCHHKGDHQIILAAGPGSDRFTSLGGHTASSLFFGGEGGNDTIVGSADDEILSGNDGNDVIRSGPGDDELWAGAGVDTLDYSERTVRIVVDLTVKLGNGDGPENDKLMDAFDNIASGSGDDELHGNDAANDLTSGKGEDKLYGRGGNDVVHVREGVRDWVDCGDGTDIVHADFEDLVNGSCEDIRRANPGPQSGGEGLGTPDSGPGPLPPPPPPVDPDDPSGDGGTGDTGGTGGDSGTGGSGDAAPPAAVPGDTLAPVLGKVAFAPKRFRRRSALRFSLSEAASVTIRVQRLRTARKPRGKGRLLRVGAAGANQISFSRRVARKRLRPGRYRVKVVAIDGAGNRSKVRYATFRVKR